MESKKLRFKKKDFFVKIKGYGKNSDWAKEIINTADTTVQYIRENKDFEKIIKYITDGVKKANQLTSELKKQLNTGVLRAKREDWQNVDDECILVTPYGKRDSIYRKYRDRFDNIFNYPLKNPFPDKFSLTRSWIDDYGKILFHPDSEYINASLDMVRDLYNDLHKNYIEKEATKVNLNDINNKIAKIRWILAHSTPWKRGSDTISNTFIRSIYKAMGIKASPLKKGISLDLEAYCTNLEEYKNNFSSYFKKSPYIAE